MREEYIKNEEGTPLVGEDAAALSARLNETVGGPSNLPTLAPVEIDFESIVTKLPGSGVLDSESELVGNLTKEILNRALSIYKSSAGPSKVIPSIQEALLSFEALYISSRDAEWECREAEVQSAYDKVQDLHGSLMGVSGNIVRLSKEASLTPGAISEKTSSKFSNAANEFQDSCEALGTASSWKDLGEAITKLKDSSSKLLAAVLNCRDDVGKAVEEILVTIDATGNKRWYLSDPEFRSPSTLTIDGAPIPDLISTIGHAIHTIEEVSGAYNATDKLIEETEERYELSPISLLPRVRALIAEHLNSTLSDHERLHIERDKLSNWDKEHHISEVRAVLGIREVLEKGVRDRLRMFALQDLELSFELVPGPIPDTPQVAIDSPMALVIHQEENRLRAALITRFGLVEIAHLRWNRNVFPSGLWWINDTMETTFNVKHKIDIPASRRIHGANIWALSDEATVQESFRLLDTFEKVDSKLLAELWNEVSEIINREKEAEKPNDLQGELAKSQ